MKIQLSDHFTYGKLIRFTIPSIAMMVVTSIYGVVDGFFISNFAGKTPFSAVNLIIPFLMIVATVGFMFGTGGTAIVAKTLGEGHKKRANQYFSLFVYTAFVLGVLFSFLGFIFIRPISVFLGAEGTLLEDWTGGNHIGWSYEYDSCGVLVISLPQEYKLEGAAIATAMSQIVGGGIPLFYFAGKNKSILRLGKTRLEWSVILKACINGLQNL